MESHVIIFGTGPLVQLPGDAWFGWGPALVLDTLCRAPTRN